MEPFILEKLCYLVPASRRRDPAWSKELNPRQNSGWFYQAVFKKRPEGEVPVRYLVPALCWFGSTLATRFGLRAFDLSGLENSFFGFCSTKMCLVLEEQCPFPGLSSDLCLLGALERIYHSSLALLTCQSCALRCLGRTQHSEFWLVWVLWLASDPECVNVTWRKTILEIQVHVKQGTRRSERLLLF